MTREQSDRAKLVFQWTWDVVIKVAFPILLGMAGWVHVRLLDLDGRVIRIEASRYTAEDARRDRLELRSELSALATVMNANTSLLQRLDERVAQLQRESANGR